ncbi:sorbin and SH3 domain-containing protein 1-like isoform X1 [Rhopilema esculentum]|uniref:sorbin and SH3 domain-containing protein 1-like isoform X1 n=2 Tax=Rhopilema esculentum TaxID=499914 RepID=UPI0031DAD9EB
MSSFEVCLKGGGPWGFRLHGGKEFGTPLRISKLEQYGKAEAAGLKLNDEILEINGRDVGKLYHTEALVVVKKAANELRMVLYRSSANSSGQEKIEYKQENTYVDTNRPPAYNDYHNYTHEGYTDKERKSSEWSPDIINDVTRIPDPIAIETGPGQYVTEDPLEDPEERKRKAPQAPTSPRGFEKVQPSGRGRRRLTSSGNSSFEMFEDRKPENVAVDMPFISTVNSALRHLQSNRAEADPDYRKSYTSSLPRSLGKKSKTMEQNRSATLPRNLKSDEKGKPGSVPNWYKEMQKEINKSMEGQSHLGRLLTADAAKGAFRRYDGASSPRHLSPNSSQRRPRPKSIHIDRFQFDNESVPESAKTKDDMSKNSAMTNLEKREKRHSVHSNWYREFQKGGQIPAAGLAAEPDEASAVKPVHARSRSSDDILSGNKGMPYQAPDQRSPDTRFTNPAKFEYNNPPDFLELRKKAEAEGALREERERELRMLQEERRKWLEEEEKLKAMSYDARKKAEEERREQARLRDEQMRIQREKEIQLQREREMQRALEIEENNRRKMEAMVQQNNAKNEILGEAKAIYTFRSQSPAEISFKKGQLITVFRQIDENWYEGEVDGQVGIFPANYIQIIETKEAPPEEEEDAGTIQIEEGIARAKYKFQAENDKEISFKKNDMITLLRKLDDNWYEGEIEDQIGIFPVNYVEILREPRIIKSEVAPAMSGELVKSSEKPKQIAREEKRELNLTNGGHREEKKPVQQQVLETEPSQSIHSGKVVNNRNEPEKTPLVKNEPSGERNRAIYGYAPMSEDEIELFEGDIVFVLEKCDDGWFVGVCERTGKFGTFPGNYVVPV